MSGYLKHFAFEFLTRVGCHLCEQARPVVQAEVTRVNGHLVEVDIESDAALIRDFGLRIPVLLAPDGAVVAEGVIDARGLRRSLRNWSGRRKAT